MSISIIPLATLTFSWRGRKRIQDEFCVSQYQARQSVLVRAQDGILPDIRDHRGNEFLSLETVDAVLTHYQSDIISKQSPKSRDVVQIKQPDGSKKAVACRLMLFSVDEAYSDFVEFHKSSPSISLGRTKYYYLRPKWVKTSPVHNDCLCIYHENYRLLVKVIQVVELKLVELFSFDSDSGTC